MKDYELAYQSRQVSLLGRKEVFMGKAKFGIFGDGKELPQIALSHFIQKGDWRAGYYRDQTMMFASGNLTVEAFFAQLYADTNLEHEPATGGRSMNAHFATRFINSDNSWADQLEQFNSAADISCTAGQMPRMVGLAFASKLYKNNKALQSEDLSNFSNKGREVTFGTIGNGSAAEGHFFEAVNAAGVLQIPMVLSVWDDGYAISVPNKYQVTKGSISEILKGFQRTGNSPGLEIIEVKAWDYLGLLRAYEEATMLAREFHIPSLVHVTECTQPQGHSTSGSHTRYKSEERLKWEDDFDGIAKLRAWILEEGMVTEEDLVKTEKKIERQVKDARKKAWNNYQDPIKKEKEVVVSIVNEAITKVGDKQIKRELDHLIETLNHEDSLNNQMLFKTMLYSKRILKKQSADIKNPILDKFNELKALNEERYNSKRYGNLEELSSSDIHVPAKVTADSKRVDGREVVNSYFFDLFKRDKRVFALGEDVGKIGDVNQGFAGLQEEFGEIRITDTGIRELTIIGQGLGAAMRGLRPIIEVQYFDYIFYALQPMTDDIACLRYRSSGGQAAPMIIRTRGHRLEGIWHSGSPMASVLNAIHGMYFIAPRNLTKAAAFYNTLMKGDDPALVVEPLNGYRLKEQMPENLSEMCEPLGHPEIIREGSDLTIVTYGSMCRIVIQAASELSKAGIEVEVVDVQTLIPYDVTGKVVESIKRTNRVIFADEDMPGGTTGYMMQQTLDKQDAWQYLDSKPVCISAKPHRPAYADDGDYFSKPNADTIYEAVMELMEEAEPSRF